MTSGGKFRNYMAAATILKNKNVIFQNVLNGTKAAEVKLHESNLYDEIHLL
jgi:hypothetical protein